MRHDRRYRHQYFHGGAAESVRCARQDSTAMGQRQFEILISEAVLEEYVDVFTHAPAIALIDAQFLIDEIEASSRRVGIKGTLQVCKDPDDDIFLETAVVGGADFLVTKNLKHFPRQSYEGVRIVNVATFLQELEKTFPV